MAAITDTTGDPAVRPVRLLTACSTVGAGACPSIWPVGYGALWTFTEYRCGCRRIALIRPGSTPSTQPLTPDSSGGRPPGAANSGTTTGPATPGGPRWMWAAVGGAILRQRSVKQTRRSPRRMRADPTPLGSPGPGTSASPVSLASRTVEEAAVVAVAAGAATTSNPTATSKASRTDARLPMSFPPSDRQGAAGRRTMTSFLCHRSADEYQSEQGLDGLGREVTGDHEGKQPDQGCRRRR
jgi:hypothetical protein